MLIKFNALSGTRGLPPLLDDGHHIGKNLQLLDFSSFSSVFPFPGLNSDERIFEADFGGPFPVTCWSAVLFVAGYLALLVAGSQLLKSRERLSCRTKLLLL